MSQFMGWLSSRWRVPDMPSAAHFGSVAEGSREGETVRKLGQSLALIRLRSADPDEISRFMGWLDVDPWV